MNKKDFQVGDKVQGSWRDEATGETYFQKGIIIENPETGKWVQTEPDGGITPLKYFFHIRQQHETTEGG